MDLQGQDECLSSKIQKLKQENTCGETFQNILGATQ